jgi:lysophospholipase L1-like esterase
MGYLYTDTSADLLATQSALGISRVVPSNKAVAALGDSLTAFNSTTGIFNAKGPLVRARALCKNSFYFGHELNFGVYGETTAQILSRVAAVIAARPARVLGMHGTNDFAGGLTSQQTYQNTMAIIAAIVNAGIAYDWMPIPPRTYDSDAGGANLTAIQDHIHNANNKIRAAIRALGRSDVCVVPVDDYLTDRGSATGAPIANACYAEPGGNLGYLHLQGYGAAIAAQAIAAHYAQIFPPAPRHITANNNVLSATNPSGAVRSNPLMTGTGGTAGAGSTGSPVVATGWKIERSAGSTLTWTSSKGTGPAPQGGETQIIPLGGGSGGIAAESVRLVQNNSSIPTTGLSVGDKVVLEAEVDTSGLTNVRAIYVQLYTYLTGAVLASVKGPGSTGYTADREPASNSYRLSTPPLTIASPGSVLNTNDTLGAHLYIECDCTGAGVSGTVTVKSMEVITV